MRKQPVFPVVNSLRYSANFNDDTEVPASVRDIFLAAHMLAGQASRSNSKNKPLLSYVNGERSTKPDDNEELFHGYPFGLHTIHRAAVTVATRPNKRDKVNPQLVAYIRDSIIQNNVRILDIQAGQLIPGQSYKQADLEHVAPIAIGGFDANIGRLTIRATALSRQQPSRPGLSGTPSTLTVTTPVDSPSHNDMQDMHMTELVGTIDTVAPWITDLQRRFANMVASLS